MQGEAPASTINLAVGSVSNFEKRLFGKAPMRCFDGTDREFHAWRDSMITEMGDWQPHFERLKARFQPLMEVEPDGNGPLSQQASKLLGPVGAKIAPHLSRDQATAWRTAVVLALSDLPADVVLMACKAVLHEPMKYLGDVETNARKCAKETIAHLNNASRRLGEMGRGIPSLRIKDKSEEVRFEGPC